MQVSGSLKKRTRIAALFVGGISLSGCMGLDPVSYTAVKLSIDGISMLSTGKSTTDHAMSAVTGYDCNMLNVFEENRKICEEWDQSPREAFAGRRDDSHGPRRELAALPQAPYRMETAAGGTGTGNSGTPYFSLWAPQH